MQSNRRHNSLGRRMGNERRRVQNTDYHGTERRITGNRRTAISRRSRAFS